MKEKTFKDFEVICSPGYDMLLHDLFGGTCRYCGVDTHAINEYFMVSYEVWATVNLDSEGEPILVGQLCIGCVEGRLGRKLAPSDFTDCNVNTMDDYQRSDRYVDRLGSSFRVTSR